ncbi:MAG: DnaJ domain-containing protein, partial [Blastocatellia bacterium]|nr:DnaJ domain-containing protein [Blastocatellia bacterium]
LTCSDGLATKSIYFEQGAIVYAKSTLREDRLGETLIRVGRITQTDFDRATTVMKQDGIRFGAALIKLGKIDEVELKPLITEQFSSIVYSLFEWSKGAFEFTTGEPRKRSIKISLSTADIIFEGLRRMQNIELIKAWLGDFSWKLSITSDPLLLYQSVNLTPKEGFIVSRIESKMSVDEILSLGGLPEDETLKTICGLLAVGILRWVDRETGGYSVPISTVLADSQQQPAIFDIQTAAAFCYEVENILRSLDKMSHYAVLGIARSATTEQIHEAYALLARKFHPDRHAQLAEYNLSIQSDLENIFERVLEAYHVLSNPITRQVYDQSFKATGAYRVALPKQVAPAANRAEPVVAQTPFSIVKSESIKTEEPKRPSTLEEPVKAASKIEEAQKWFDRGMTYYGSQQFRQACHAFQTSVDLEPNNPEYRIFLARSLAQIKGHHTRAKEHFSKALELEPNNPDYLAEVGLFYQKLGLIKQADIMFEKVLEIVPDHPIARRARSEE